MTSTPSLVFLLDVDNTLLNNDAVKDAIGEKVGTLIGEAGERRFWEIYEDVRAQKGYVDFPTTVARLASDWEESDARRSLMSMLDNFPFRDYLYPHALDTIHYLNTLGEAVILSDGDPTFQPLKIRKSGIAAAVHARVLVVVHKEDELDKVFARYPAGHYVAVDDKPRIVAALEWECPTTFTTVLVEQGKYAQEDRYTPAPDIVVAAIADLRDISRAEFLHPHPGNGSAG